MNDNKKAIVVGGSNGAGLAISKKLIERGYFVEICSRTAPDDGTLLAVKYHHSYCGLSDPLLA